MLEAYNAYMSLIEESTSSSPQPGLPALGKYTNEQLFFISYGSVWCNIQTIESLAGQLASDVHAPHKAR